MSKPKLALTRIANACVLLEVDGHTVLTDPWFTGRWYLHRGEPLGLPVAELPPLTAIVVSNAAPNHWALRALTQYPHKATTPVYVSGRRMARQARAIGYRRVEVLAWHECRDLAPALSIEAVPAGRTPLGRNNAYVMTSEHIRVFFGGEIQDVTLQYLELCVLDHPAAGPGAQWSRRIRAGLPIAFTRPTGRLVPRESVQYHLFMGDETASVAFGAILRDLPGHAGVHGVIEIEEPCDRLPLHRGGELHWIRRGDGVGLVDALRTLDLPDHPGAAYIAGEARDCQAARRHLIADRAWPSRSVITKPFWTPGKRGLD